jgi:hypothetical protein
MTKHKIVILLVILFLVYPAFFLVIYAQPPIPPVPESPIDGGVSILLIIGLFFGIKKLFKSNRK